MNTNNFYDIEGLIDKIKHFLPNQAPLKDFIHHNTLHAFQEYSFHDALHRSNLIFGNKSYLQLSEYRKLYASNKISSEAIENSLVKHNALHLKENILYKVYNEELFPRIESVRKHWKDSFHIDMDAMVHPLLFRILSNYLDQGIAVWNSPFKNLGFLNSIREIEKNSVASFFRTKSARELLFDESLSLFDLISMVVGDPNLFEHYLFDQQFAHPGWSGMVAYLSDNSKSLMDGKHIDFISFIHFETLLEIDALNYYFGEIWSPISFRLKENPSPLFDPTPRSELSLVKEIWQDAYEWNLYKDAIHLIEENASKQADLLKTVSLQAIFCIDDRNCSLRRHIEQIHSSIETFGTAGHFNLEFYFKPELSPFYIKVCPAPITPKFLIKEIKCKDDLSNEGQFKRKAKGLLNDVKRTTRFSLWSGIKLLGSIFKPSHNPTSVSSSMHMENSSALTIEFNGEFSEDGLQIGFTVPEMTDRIEVLLKSIGLVNNYAPLLYIIGHGSSSSNNTHYAGYDCGACSGRPGSVNARVMSYIGNHEVVRKELKKRGIDIPKTTQFVGVLHDTCRDEMNYFDEGLISIEHQELHEKNKLDFIRAMEFNALERSRRFLMVNHFNNRAKVHAQVKKRSTTLFEPRPELNHATNSFCIVGRRSLTKDLFLDRRSFLNSYDYSIDPNGLYLKGILDAVAPVCGGINLEYYFSRVDNQMLGAGTKLPHNVMGLIGVANGVDGDLRTGLPKQMIEVHDPIRLLLIVEHFPSVVLQTIQTNPKTFEWFSNEWIRLVAFDPEEKQSYLFEKSKFIPFKVLDSNTTTISIKELEDLLKSEHDNLPFMHINS